MAGTLKSLLVRLGVDSKAFDKGMDHAEGRTNNLASTFRGLSKVGGAILLGAGAAALAGGVAFGLVAKTALMAAGRVEQLIGVNKVLAKNLGISNDLVREQSVGMRKQGIEAAVVEETLAKMMQAELDVADAIDIASIAQNAAVIAGSNSSETMSRIIHGITTFNPLVLRNAGLIVDQALAYDELAESLGKSTADLTAAEKQQAMLNAVKKAGVKIEGAYDESMKNPIKQLGSLKRLFNDVAVALGGPFLEGFSLVISAISEAVKWFGAAVSEGGKFKVFLERAGIRFRKFIETVITNIPIMIAKFRELGAWFKDNKGVVVGVLAAMGVAVLAFGVSVAIAAWTALAPMLPVIAVLLAVAAVAYLLYEAWTNNWGGIQEKTAVAVAWIKKTVANFLDKLRELWLRWGPKIAKFFQAVWTKVKEIWIKFTAFITPLVRAFQAAFAGDWYTFGKKLRIFWDNAWTLIRNALSNAFNLIKTAVLKFLPKIKTWFTSINWGQVGLNIIKGIAKGITNAVGWIKRAAKNAAKAAFSAAKGFLGIHSPSKLFAGIGQNMMLGMASGISDFSRVPISVTADVTRNVATTAGRAEPAQARGSSQPVFDYARMSRMIRDAMLQVTE